MSPASESPPLLNKAPQKQKSQKHTSCHVKYRLPKITEKGAIVMIVCNVLALTAIFAQLHRIYLTTITSIAFVVIALITGIVADTCVERFKVFKHTLLF